MNKSLFVIVFITLLAICCPALAEELSEDFYTGLSIQGPQKSLGSYQNRAYALKNKALSSIPVDEKWELRDLISEYAGSGFTNMSQEKVRRFSVLIKKASRILTPEEHKEVAFFGKLIREGKSSAPAQDKPVQGGSAATPVYDNKASEQADSGTSVEGLFVKRYTCGELARLAGSSGSADDRLLEQLRYAGLMIEKKGKSGTVERAPATLKNFSFHTKGRFQFVRYSADRKSIFVSYMYPGKGRDRKDYDSRLSNRNILARWDTSTGRLMTVLMAEKNSACAVAMSNDDKTVIYHLDLPGSEKLKDGSYETVKNLLYSIEISGEIGAPRRIVSLARGDDVLYDAFPTLDNIIMSPDGRYIAFSARFKAIPGKGNTIIVETASGKRHFYPNAYGSGTPGMPNAASMVFSPDGRQLAMGIPSKVDEWGVTEAWIKILDARSLESNEEIRKIPSVTTGFKLGSILYSPDGRYLVRFVLGGGGKPSTHEFVTVDTGETFCSLLYKDMLQCFSPDGRFYLNFSPHSCDIAFVDKTTCFWLQPGYYPIHFDGGVQKAVFSPDGRHIALAGQAKGANMLQIVAFNEPDEKQINTFRRAEGALKMYSCGMQKEAIAAAEEVIKAAPMGLYLLSYGQRLADASMPLFLRGELCRRAYERASGQKYNRLGLQWKPGEAGMIVTKVNPNTPAQKAGFAIGDIVTGIGGKSYTTEQGYQTAYYSLTPDQPADLEILRGGSPMKLKILPIKSFSRYPFGILMEYAQTAIEAGHPAIARQAVNIVNTWIREGRLDTDRGMMETLLVVEASALASAGKEQEAFTLLREHKGFEKFGSADGAIRMQPGAFYHLLKDRRKLADAMMFDEYRLLPEPQKPGPPQPYPDLTGKM
ncbi:MAG: PDZ domain-containing protein [Candidatus Xenobiia bacterium LiM19]